MDNNYIDKAVREAVGDYEVDFATPDWEEMESRLDQDNALRRKLYLTKAVEVCLVLFAIWTVVPFLESEPHHEATPPAAIESIQHDTPIAAASSAEPAAPTDVRPALAPATPSAVVPPFSPIAVALAANAAPPTVMGAVPLDTETPSSEVWYTRTVPTPSVPSSPDLAAHSAPSYEQPLATTLWDERPIIAAAPVATHNTLLREPMATALRRPSGVKKSAALSPRSRISIGAIAATEWLNIQETHTIALSRKARRINPAMGIVANFAATERLQVEAALLGIQRQQVERRFEPMPYNKGILGARKSIQTTAVELQTNVSYNFGQLGKTKLFAMAGLSNYLALMSDQRLMEKNLFASAQFDASTAASPPSLGNAATNTPRVESYPASSVPSTLSHRHQLSLNLGVSAEIELTDKWTLFARMLYKNGLTTIGPFDDQVSALNMGAGVRTQL